MNKNDKIRNDKEAGIKEAIQYLHEKGFQNFNNKIVANTTKALFKDNPNKQISANSLSKIKYYKENIGKWIEEITGANQLEIGRENSLVIRKENAKKNYLQIQKEAKRIVLEIVNGTIKCDKMTKKYLTNALIERKDKKNYKINPAIFSSDFYKPIYDEVVTLLNQEISTSNVQKGITLEGFSKIKAENERLKQMNNNFISNLFFIKEGENIVEEKKLLKTIIDTKKLYYYLKLNEDIFLNSKGILAYSLFEGIVNTCERK